MRNASVSFLLAVVLLFPGCSDSTNDGALAPPPPGDLSARDDAETGPSASSVPSDEPRPYEPPNGQFRVVFPGEPSLHTGPADTEAGTLGEDRYSVIRLPRAYLFMCTHRAAPRDPQEEIAWLIKDSQRGNDGLKVLESKDVTLKGRPGKDMLTALEEEGRLVRERFLIDGKDLYHLIAHFPEDDDEARAAASSFVESFELLKD